ncbi:LysM peptidoglycan-binding domain-containing protein [Bacteriovoracaceae bacterium]|nr:LysM peptidoglycan-binding domain-containing protein [Bacteriovoracaceae bacterium]
MIRNLFTLTLVLVFAACSGNKKETTVEENAEGIEVADYTPPTDEIATEEVDQTAESTEEVMTDDATETTDVAATGEEKEYTVIKGDTLMLISFKIFGKYERWREILESNKDVIVDQSNLQPGTTLTYVLTEPVPAWNPEGNPYLIKENDTLGIISDNVYQTPKYWKEIWQNNKPLIKDPNVIFAGFTIYTPIINVPQSAAVTTPAPTTETETEAATTTPSEESEATEATN